ncbi:MAG: TraR/DksA C4-type zinc finger protein [Paludibacteraceae bacterium]|nr:TraR/DksA C4-type zinc finger protein [Paludibacteraceae bacterium]
MEEKVRYSDEELQEFREIIEAKLARARAEFNELTSIMSNSGNDVNDTSPTFKNMEEGASTLSKEAHGQMAQRTMNFIHHLEDALVRINNKTYGICRETGKLIPKARLMRVPHATLTVEAKEKLAKNKK